MYTQVKNPQWVDLNHSAINCEVIFENIGADFIPFSANPNDSYEYGREIYARCLSGEFGIISEPVIDLSSTVPQPNVDGAQTL